MVASNLLFFMADDGSGSGNGQFDWTPSESDVAASPYSITFTATDDNGVGLSSAETIQITVNSAAGGSGNLITGDAPAPSSANLTANGPTDWVHWGLTSPSSVDRKAAVTPQISALTTVGDSARRYNPPTGVRVDYTWSDGTPTAAATTTTGLWLPGVGNRFELSVPADTSLKTLTLYAGSWRARGQLDFSLSDGSAAPTSVIIDNPSGPIDREVTISFAAASAVRPSGPGVAPTGRSSRAAPGNGTGTPAASAASPRRSSAAAARSPCCRRASTLSTEASAISSAVWQLSSA